MTAAMEMLGGGSEIAASCRKPEIMADAAYAMLCKDSRSYTGNFAIDEDVLRDVGMNDMEQYACVPGQISQTWLSSLLFTIWSKSESNNYTAFWNRKL